MVSKTENECDCPVARTLKVIGGKWKSVILWYLSDRSVLRFNELKRLLPNITYKMLSQHLKEMETDGIIRRKEYHQIPPKVEYSLTERGKTLLPIIGLMYEWSAAPDEGYSPDMRKTNI